MQLCVDALVKHYKDASRAGTIRAVDGVSFSLAAGETLAVVGESGCGKSTIARMLVGLVRPSSGSIYVGNRDLVTANASELREMRRMIQLVFQDPYSSLNPRRRVEFIVAEPLLIHSSQSSVRRHRERTELLLEQVGLSKRHLDRFPRELSGGQRQRVAIARALALDPQIIVLDEPVSALDVSIQAQVMNLLKDLQRERGLSYLFISHDLGVVRYIADRVAVMFAGRIVECGESDAVFFRPEHPYTDLLLSAVPRPVPGRTRVALSKSDADDPDASEQLRGCRFRARCVRPTTRCDVDDPALRDWGGGRQRTACHHPTVWPKPKGPDGET